MNYAKYEHKIETLRNQLGQESFGQEPLTNDATTIAASYFLPAQDEFETKILRYNEKSLLAPKVNTAGKQVVRNVKEGTMTMQKKGSLVVKDIKPRIPNEVPLRNKHTFKVEQDAKIHSSLVTKDIKSKIPNEVPLRNKHTLKVEQDAEIHHPDVKVDTKTMQKKGSLRVKDIKSMIPNEVPLENKHTLKVEQDDKIHSPVLAGDFEYFLAMAEQIKREKAERETQEMMKNEQVGNGQLLDQPQGLNQMLDQQKAGVHFNSKPK